MSMYFKKSIQYYIFLFLKYILSKVNKFKISLEEDKEELSILNNKANVSRIYCRFLLNDGLNRFVFDKEDFLYIHEKFDDPKIVLNDSMTLYTITATEAVFVDCGENDILKAPYLCLYQQKKALKMVTLPIETFHLMANKILIPKIPLVHIANHGRCGSTLMRKIFEEIPNTLILAEPGAFLALTTLVRKFEVSQQEAKQLCRSVLKCLLKHANTRSSKLVCIEDWSTCVFIADLLCEVWPSMKHIYLFRQPVPYVRSWQKLEIYNNWREFNEDMLVLRCGFPHLNGHPMYDVEFLKRLSPFGKIALMSISYNAAFESFIRNGYPIPSVKFDDFIKTPKTIMLKVFKHFKLPYELLPDLDKVFTIDSQEGTGLSSRSADQNQLRKCLSPITDAVEKEVNMMCREYNMPLFWKNDYYLSNNIDSYV